METLCRMFKNMRSTVFYAVASMALFIIGAPLEGDNPLRSLGGKFKTRGETMRSRNRFAASEVMPILCLVVGLLLAGQPAAAQEPIRIGALFALSGPDASIGTPAQLVTRMVVDKINKEGGINDRPIQLVLGDTQGDPSKTVMEAGRLVEQEKVIAIIGPTSTDTGMAVKPYIEETAEVPSS